MISLRRHGDAISAHQKQNWAGLLKETQTPDPTRFCLNRTQLIHEVLLLKIIVLLDPPRKLWDIKGRFCFIILKINWKKCHILLNET